MTRIDNGTLVIEEEPKTCSDCGNVDELRLQGKGDEMKGLLKAEVVNDVLTITIGLESLKNSIESGILDISCCGEVRVTSMESFQESFLDELMSEDSNGTTPIHKMFDDVAGTCLENGKFGIDVHKEI